MRRCKRASLFPEMNLPEKFRKSIAGLLTPA